MLLASEAGDEHVPKRTFNAAFTAVCGHPVGADTKLTRCADVRIAMAILLLTLLVADRSGHEEGEKLLDSWTPRFRR